ncbi:MAG: hypothetical protein IPK32_09545 [Verrucomicrobiaceae bacterium]|nr:hypothetical protein [Verrucomicrobiaceae bacterium]
MTKNRLFLILPLFLVLAAGIFRYLKLAGWVSSDVWTNFAPWMALAFTGTLVISRRMPFWLTPALLILVDLSARGLQTVLHGEAIAVYACYALAAWIASGQRGRLGLLGSLLGVIGCTFGFYLITNTISWIVDPGYVKNLSGWMQALTSGLPGLPPTTIFLYKSLLSDLAFSCMLLAAYNTEATLRREKTIPVLGSLAAA